MRTSAENNGFVPDNYIVLSNEVLAPIYGPLAETVLSRISLAPTASHFVDLGGGSGLWLDAFFSRGLKMGSLVDHEWEMTSYAAHKFGQRLSADRWNFLVGDAQAIPFKADCVDLVVSRNSMHLWQDLEQCWQEIGRILRSGGYAFLGRGYGPDLTSEDRQRVKKDRKALRDPNDPPCVEPPSPPAELVSGIARKVGFDMIDIIRDDKSYWILARKILL